MLHINCGYHLPQSQYHHIKMMWRRWVWQAKTARRLIINPHVSLLLLLALHALIAYVEKTASQRWEDSLPSSSPSSSSSFFSHTSLRGQRPCPLDAASSARPATRSRGPIPTWTSPSVRSRCGRPPEATAPTCAALPSYRWSWRSPTRRPPRPGRRRCWRATAWAATTSRAWTPAALSTPTPRRNSATPPGWSDPAALSTPGCTSAPPWTPPSCARTGSKTVDSPRRWRRKTATWCSLLSSPSPSPFDWVDWLPHRI